jgi:hypothetical protein
MPIERDERGRIKTLLGFPIIYSDAPLGIGLWALASRVGEVIEISIPSANVFERFKVIKIDAPTQTIALAAIDEQEAG